MLEPRPVSFLFILRRQSSRCCWLRKGFRHYWRSHYLDQTFKGLYRWNAFDTAMLIPYFIVMIILAFYGIHRYQLVWLYFKNKKNAAKWNEPPTRFAEGAAAVCDDPAADLQ